MYHCFFKNSIVNESAPPVWFYFRHSYISQPVSPTFLHISTRKSVYLMIGHFEISAVYLYIIAMDEDNYILVSLPFVLELLHVAYDRVRRCCQHNSSRRLPSSRQCYIHGQRRSMHRTYPVCRISL